jgi:imidazoleglycerol-phosphate dehydratase
MARKAVAARSTGGKKGGKKAAAEARTSSPETRAAARPARATGSGKRTARRAALERTTRETSVFVDLSIDGSGASTISTGVPFLDHMLELWSKHGFFDLVVRATGDLAVDQHHTVEDVGLTLGQVLREALGDKAGIRRFGQASVPLDEALVSVVVDLSGRPYLVYELDPGQERVGDFDTGLVHDFLLAFVNELRMNLHIDCIRGRNPHHMIEAMFKGLGRALDTATQLDPRVTGVLSTKGLL